MNSVAERSKGARMKLHIMSDLHLGFSPMQAEKVDADLVILAGDINVGAAGVKWAMHQFDCPVLYVPGNHEYYQTEWTMDELLTEMRYVAEGSDVHVMDRDRFELGGVRFLATTLWTDLHDKPFSGIECGVLGSDTGYIRVAEGKGFTSDIAQPLFEQNRDWLCKELAQPFDGPTVVITHHAPSGGSLSPEFASNPWNSCFITDMEAMMGDGVDLWVHGHTHTNFDYHIKGTRVLCNPRGYTNHFGGTENPSFDPAMVVHV